MLGKKGMEISINVIVMIILGLIMFSAAIAIFTNLFQGIKETELMISEQMRERLIRNFPTSELVFLPETTKSPQRKLFTTDNQVRFYVGIYNDKDTNMEFKLNIEPTEASRGAGLEQDKITYLKEPHMLGAKKRDIYVFIINIEGLESGKQYGAIVNVTREEGSDWVQHGRPRIAYVDLR